MVAGLWLESTSRQPLADALGGVGGVMVVRRVGPGNSCGVEHGQWREEQRGLHGMSNHFTFQIFTSSIHTVFGIRKLNQRFIGWAKPSER